MRKKIWKGVIVAGLICIAYLLGLSQASWIPRLPCDTMRTEIDVYRLCMQYASKTGCRMQVDDFWKYHQLKAELDKRCTIPQS